MTQARAALDRRRHRVAAHFPRLRLAARADPGDRHRYRCDPGRLLYALTFTIEGDKITQYTAIADPERLSQLTLAVPE